MTPDGSMTRVAARAAGADITWLDPRSLVEDAANVRRESDDADLAGLAATIREYGVLQPLGVRRVDGRHVLVYGSRRRRAAVLAGLSVVPCVEVIPAGSTDDQVVQKVLRALTRLGKAAVVVGDGPGFVANRIQFALFREAARIVEDGVATPAQVDEVVRSSFGFRLPFFGPFTIADMAGLDVYADIFDTLEDGLGPGFSAPRALRDHVARGDFGVKAGRGFLDLSQREADELIERRDRAYAGLARLRSELEA
jgi:hypothetical protein